MKRLKFSLTILVLAVLAMWPNLSFAEIEKAVVKIEGGMQCSL